MRLTDLHCGQQQFNRLRLMALTAVLAIAIPLLPMSASAGDATLTWNSSSGATGYKVHYGTQSNNYTQVIDVGNVVTKVVSGLTDGITYYFAVTAYNSSGESGYSNEGSKLITSASPPVISAITATNISSSSAVIGWATDKPATSQVEYGPTTAYGTLTTLSTSLVTSHSQALGGLQGSTLYHYRVWSVDSANNVAMSADNTFTTSPAPDTTPPTISGVSASNLTSTGAVISWTTNELSTTQVNYGLTASYGTSSPLNSTLVTSHSVTLSGLTAATTYHYRVRSADAASNLATSGDFTFTTSPAPDTTPPTISGVTASNLTSTGAMITWTTNETATTQVNYGLTVLYGTSSPLNSTLVTSHSVTLSGLTAATTYHYRVRSADAASNLATSGDFTFTTSAAPDTTPPVISGVTASNLTSTGAVITWTTNEAATSQADYGLSASYGTSSPLNNTLMTSHSVTLGGLTAATTYHYRVRSADAASNLANSGDFTFTTSAAPDTTPPVLSGITTSSLSNSDATITWTTNEAATTQVEYGPTTSYGSSTTLSGTLVTSHSKTLQDLTASTTYHFRVKSADAASNLATSGDFTFTTSAAPDTIPPVISGVTASNLISTGAVITWTTNEAASSQADYGLTAGYGTSSPLNSTLATSHSVTLGGLTAATTYHYRVKSADAASNLATSGDFTFTTSAAPDTTPPTISGVTASNLTSTGAVITWTTNEAASSQADYGLTAGYGTSSPLNSTLMTSHSVTLSGLTAATTYHYRVKSADASGNLATSGDFIFTTTSAVSDTTPPGDPQNFTAVAGDQQITLSWTNPPDGDFVGVRIQYRTDHYPVGMNDGTLLGDFTGQPSAQKMTIVTGLQNGVTYYFAAESYDLSGNFQSTAHATATPGSQVVDLTGSGGCGGGGAMIKPWDKGSSQRSGQSFLHLVPSYLFILIAGLLKWWKKAFSSLLLPITSFRLREGVKNGLFCSEAALSAVAGVWGALSMGLARSRWRSGIDVGSCKRSDCPGLQHLLWKSLPRLWIFDECW